MILVSEAGSKRSSGFSAASTWPLVTSATIQARPATEGGVGACASASDEKRQSRKKKWRSMLPAYDHGAQAEFRLDAVGPAEEALRRALAIMAMPRNVAQSLALGWRSADAMWRLAGDTATDLNHYSKRAILAAVYSVTVLYWLRDTSEDNAETLAFLDRRLAGVGRIGRMRGRVDALLARIPRPSRLRMGDTG